MKTMIQSFLVEETKELIYDSDSLNEWKAKCEELGLQHQLSLAKPEKSPIPFECMNTVQQRVYETLCPTKELYREYKRTAIPLEVLSLIALSEKEHYFDEIEIWYDNTTTDPFAIGVLKKGSWERIHYCIARWADELQSFDTLKEKAIKLHKASSLISLRKKLADTKTLITNIDNNVAAYFDGQSQDYEVLGF